MKFIQQAYKGNNEWWTYLVSLIILFFGWQFIGVIPLVGTAFFYAEDSNEFIISANDNFASLGMDSNLYLFLMILSFLGGLISLFFGVKFIHKRNIVSLITSRAKVDWNRFLYAFVLWASIGVSMIAIGYFVSPEDFVWNFKPLSFFILLVISFLFLPIQTSMEELLFRGYLMQGLGIATVNKNFWVILIYIFICMFSIFGLNQLFEIDILSNFLILIGFGFIYILLNQLNIIEKLVLTNFSIVMFKFLNRCLTPLIITSVIFGLLHGLNPEVEKLGWISMVYYIGTGLVLGIFTLMDEGTELALGFHAANNIVAAVLVTANWTVFQTDALLIDTSEPSVGWEMFVPVLILYPLVLYVFSKKYGWTNWQEKLLGSVQKPIELDEDKFIA